LIFGITSFIRGSAFFVDPLIAIIPRLLIGVMAAYSYKFVTKLINRQMAGWIAAAVIGALTNTIGVLSLAVVRGYLKFEPALGIFITHGLPEVVVASFLVVAVVKVIPNRNAE
jgi:uncharacterized membrane protein